MAGQTARRGTVFKITPSGTLTTLYSFASVLTDGNPLAGLVQGSDGNFYGTTVDGGANVTTWHGLQNHSQRHPDHAVQLRRR